MSKLSVAKKTRRTQEERTYEARAKLISAAISLINEKGFARTTMSDIAGRAGLTRGAIQHHFDGRVDLVTTILLEVESRVVESFAAAAPGPGVPLAKGIDVLIDNLGAVCQSSAYLAAMDICFTSRSDPDLRDTIRQSVRRSSDHFRLLWQSTFGPEIPEATISECRRVMVAVSRGLVMSRLFSSDPTKKPPSLDLTLATTKLLIKHHMLAAKESKEKL